MAQPARKPGVAVDCPLCAADGGACVWRDADLRVVLVDEPDYPGFTRVIWNAHVREMTDLASDRRQRLMDVVWAVESVQREVLQPEKINLASFGNVVPHLHWHVIPRWPDDTHYPEPVWGRPAGGRAEATSARRLAVRERLAAYLERLTSRLG